MAKLIYVDKNIYLDLFENRIDKFRPLGEIASQLFIRALGCEFKIILSSLIIEEIENNGYESELNILINDLKKKNKLVFVKEKQADRIAANNLKNLRKTPFKDTCHLVIATRTKAECLVTRNIKDYENLSDIIEVSLPELI